MSKKMMYQLLVNNNVIKAGERVLIDFHKEPITEERHILFTTRYQIGDYNIDTKKINIVMEM